MTDADGQLPEVQSATTQQLSDDELVRRSRAHPAEFAALYRRHVLRVYRYLLARLRDVHQAQDVTAQTFLAALENLGAYRGEGQFVSWLLGIARNKAADQHRARRSALPLEAAAYVEATGPSIEQLVAGRLELEEALRALQSLAPERAEALELRVFGGLSVAEVSAVMGKSEAAVKMLVHRAIHDLRQRLAFRNEAEP